MMKVIYRPPIRSPSACYRDWIGTVIRETDVSVTIHFEGHGFIRGLTILADRRHVEVIE